MSSHIISYERGGGRQRTVVGGASSDESLTDLFRSVFRGRLRKPDALRVSDGVKVTVRRIDRGGCRSVVVLCRRVYDKSVSQVRIEMERAIKEHS